MDRPCSSAARAIRTASKRSRARPCAVNSRSRGPSGNHGRSVPRPAMNRAVRHVLQLEQVPQRPGNLKHGIQGGDAKPGDQPLLGNGLHILTFREADVVQTR